MVNNAKTLYRENINRFFPMIYFVKNRYKRMKKNYVDQKIFNEKDSFTKNTICVKDNCIYSPITLQAASPQLSIKELNFAIDMHINSIKKLRDEYSKSICLVYIPSPATVYSPNKISYKKYHQIVSKEFIEGDINFKRSKYIRNYFENRLNDANINSLNSTNFLIKKAKSKYIHGLIDTNHFNKIGNYYLVDYILMNSKNVLFKK